ncbi:MAG TPA: hypothetical protein VHQ45_04180 [Gemmatimonadaceae bacterium]|nr:hypothetical protein [Gemmatimonadaceae bacterium]
MDARTRAALRERFATARGAAWAEGARDAGAGPGFAAQVDLAALFVERGLSLLHDGGTLALLVPAKLWRALAGGGVRRLLARHARLCALEDWSRSPPAFDAAVYPSLVVATRGAPAPQAADACVAVTEHAPGTSRRWSAPAWALPLTADPASPWPLVPPDVRGAFDLVAAAGPPLAHTPFGRPELGVKTGCNAAFVVQGDACVADADDCMRVSAGDRHGLVERTLLRPLVRGETLTPWRLHDTSERILWTHDALGRPLPALPPTAHRWLRPWRARLAARSDGHGAARWWMLHRTDGADHRAPRVVWSDFGRVPRAAVIAAGDPTVALNTCYVLRCPTLADARALAALLNSALAAAWLEPIAEPARGGYRRYLAWTMARLPLPADWPRARTLLAPMAERAEAGDAPPPDALLGAVLCAYGLAPDDVWPLLAWQCR